MLAWKQNSTRGQQEFYWTSPYFLVGREVCVGVRGGGRKSLGKYSVGHVVYGAWVGKGVSAFAELRTAGYPDRHSSTYAQYVSLWIRADAGVTHELWSSTTTIAKNGCK